MHDGLSMQWRNGANSCQHPNHAPTLSNSTTCHDGVDLPLCFEDTAILYGICVIFLVVAGFSFFFGNSRKARLPVGALHVLKLVCIYNIIGTVVYRCHGMWYFVESNIFFFQSVACHAQGLPWLSGYFLCSFIKFCMPSHAGVILDFRLSLKE